MNATLTYRKSGVNIDLADKLVDHIAKKNKAIGGFAGLFPLDLDGDGPYSLVACTDGVGTKLKVAFALNKHDTVGIDLVAMSVNDLICCGAKPLLFLDYYAMGKLDLSKSKAVLAGIMKGCQMSGCVLLGGETAEMPGMYEGGEYDLAGFAVGVVKRSEIVDGSKIFPGDLILGLPSSGLHSNGFSLVRKVFKGAALKRWGSKLLVPTRIYVKEIQKLSSALRAEGQIILGMAHITGGGLLENVPRFLPKGTKAVLHAQAWNLPPIMEEISRRGNVPDREMWRTFNMGIGMVVVIRPNSLAIAQKALPEARLIGEIVAGKSEVVIE
jgi:phosphoribosylformylglycinamidine cyclo-ligase